MPSQMSTLSGVIKSTIHNNQPYANKDEIEVTQNTAVPSTILISGAGMAATQTELMTKRLKAAEPTIVAGPNFPAKYLFPKSSVADKIISGADDPRAIRVRFAIVGFQTFRRNFCLVPSWTVFQTNCSELVISSIASMNMSQTMPMPIKMHNSPKKYNGTRAPFFQEFSNSPNKGNTRVPWPHTSQVLRVSRIWGVKTSSH
mmetsp:Transcript_53414/g.84935  ORF Transcript_53414/g.84935 Transcript_53414/m.84935 type:complete len:201 (-) Transcript_53414:48-650(-)